MNSYLNLSQNYVPVIIREIGLLTPPIFFDHGKHMEEKENIAKFYLRERSTRVPLIIYVPGMTDART